MRQILETHAAAVPEPRFRSRANATMLIAEADAASSQGRVIAALKYAIRSFLKATSKRGARSILGHLALVIAGGKRRVSA